MTCELYFEFEFLQNRGIRYNANMSRLKRQSLREFNLLSRYYDSIIIRWFFEFFYKEVQNHLGHLDGKKVLSVGCGTATLEIKLARLYPSSSITGLDLSKKMLAIAKQKANKIQNISFTEGDVDALPFLKNSFDIVLCLHSFHHYSNQINALKEMKRVLKKNGVLVVVDAIKEGITSKIKIWMVSHMFEPGVRHYSSGDLTKMVKKVGFSEVSSNNISFAFGKYILLEAFN